MKIVLLTTDEDRFGGVFAKAYQASAGPPLSAIVTLSHNSASESLNEKAAMAARLMGVRGIARIIMAKLGWDGPSDQFPGLTQQWPYSLASSATSILRSRTVKDDDFLAELNELAPDIIVSVGSPVIFGPKILDIPKIGALNIHNGLLPKYRGHFGTYWEVTQGELWAYVCAHEMISRVDSGTILDWERIEIADTDSFFDLMLAKKQKGGELLARLLRHIEEHGELPAARAVDQTGEIPDSYFPFPSADQIWKFNWRKERHRRTA